MTKKNTELESGKIKINDDVYATIVTMTALDTKGYFPQECDRPGFT